MAMRLTTMDEVEKTIQKPKIDTSADVVNQYTGEKWYYSDIVKDHFFHPRNLQLDDLTPEKFDAFGMVGSPACILPSTFVQKNPTAQSIQDVRIGDRVLGHDGSFRPVQRLFRPSFAGKLISVKNQMGVLVATDDHLIFAKQIVRLVDSPFVHTKKKKLVPSAWTHAGDLRKGDVVLYPIPKIIRNIKSIVLPRFPKKQFDFRSNLLPSRLLITEEVLELFGYFVAEGHTKKDGSEVGFTFGDTEMKYVQRVQELLKKYFKVSASFRVRPQNGRIDVTAYNVHLAHLFQLWFGEAAVKKHIPEFVLMLPPRIQAGFIRGVWRGDGHFSAKRYQPRAGFVTVSQELLHQMRWLLLRQNIIPSLYAEKAKRIRGVSHQASHRIHIGDMNSLEHLAVILKIPFQRDSKKRHAEEVWSDEDFVYLPVRSVERVSFHGRLHNFEVAKSHTYATDAFLVHNCGDMMSMGLRINVASETIKELRWKTFGCGSAIAATSMFSVMVTENGGMPIAEALKIKPQHIMERLGGLPNRKIHCSVLADKAFRKAVNDYFRRTNQPSRIIIEGARVIDQKLNITDKDIEEAVLEGAMDLEAVQKKLKVGIGSPEIITEAEQLIRFYKEKYYG
jgi:NifU-like protein involved in Fe-S cluster formation/bacterioferritin-associated ferredoxin